VIVYFDQSDPANNSIVNTIVADASGSIQATWFNQPYLAKQLKQAGTSVPSNFSEGAQRNGQDRLQHYRISGGSAAEVHTQLRVAVAWRYVSAERAAKSIDLADRAAALAWRLTHPR